MTQRSGTTGMYSQHVKFSVARKNMYDLTGDEATFESMSGQSVPALYLLQAASVWKLLSLRIHVQSMFWKCQRLYSQSFARSTTGPNCGLSVTICMVLTQLIKLHHLTLALVSSSEKL